MSEENTTRARTPRAKSDEPSAHVLTDASGKEWIVQLKAQRVASQKDLQRALYGSDLPAGVIAAK